MIIRLNRQKSTIPSFPDPNITIIFIFIHILIIFTFSFSLIFLTIMIVIISETDFLTDTMTLIQIHR